MPTRFEIRENGFYRVDEAEYYIGPQTELVKSLTKQSSRIIPGILPNGEILAVAANGTSVAHPLEFLALHTFFRPIVDVSERTCLVPVWKQGTPKAQEMQLEWKPPASMKLFVVMYWEHGTGALTAVDPLAYLVALANNKRTYLLPLPNLYEDCRICLGNNRIPWRQLGGLVPQLNKAVETLQKTSWNTDLLRDTNRYAQQMFRFDGDGKQMPPPEDWIGYCTLVNYGPYEFLAKL